MSSAEVLISSTESGNSGMEAWDQSWVGAESEGEYELRVIEALPLMEGHLSGKLPEITVGINPSVDMLMVEPGGVTERTVKAPSEEEQMVEKLLKKLPVKRQTIKKASVVHPEGEIEDMVVLWNPGLREAIVIDPVEGSILKGDNVTYEARKAMSHFMRDKHTGEEVSVSPVLILLLYDMARNFGSVLYVTSGYRQPGCGTSKGSYHTRGMAADIRHPWASLIDLRDFAANWGAGGVGFYPEANRLHVDVRNKKYFWVYFKGKEIMDMDGWWANHLK